MRIALITSLVLMLVPAAVLRAADAMSADDLANAVFKASGGDNCMKVKTIHFTFATPKSSRQHVWNVKDSTDTITVNGKSTTIKLDKMPADPAEKKMFGMWTNDSYWLVAPLKVNDKGVMRSTRADETIDGKPYHVLHLKFQDVGMTPGDQYDMFVDPQTNLVRYWDYMPKPDKKTRFSWDEYKDFSGLKLATEHKIGDTDNKIEMKDVSVEMQ
jgi:uncharacterized protein DUF6503